MASETWSAILSGWPSVTDSEVNKKRSLKLKTPSLDGIQRIRRVAIGSGIGTSMSRNELHSPEVDLQPINSAWLHAQNKPDIAPIYGNSGGRLGAKTYSVWRAISLQLRIRGSKPWTARLNLGNKAAHETTSRGKGASKSEGYTVKWQKRSPPSYAHAIVAHGQECSSGYRQKQDDGANP